MARGCLTAASPLQLHFLHVDLTGRHPDGNWVDDGGVLEERHRERGEKREMGSETDRLMKGDGHVSLKGGVICGPQ